MIKHFCDACEGEESPQALRKITPGYISEKFICSTCWGKWVNLVINFFGEHKDGEESEWIK